MFQSQNKCFCCMKWEKADQGYWHFYIGLLLLQIISSVRRGRWLPDKDRKIGPISSFIPASADQIGTSFQFILTKSWSVWDNGCTTALHQGCKAFANPFKAPAVSCSGDNNANLQQDSFPPPSSFCYHRVFLQFTLEGCLWSRADFAKVCCSSSAVSPAPWTWDHVFSYKYCQSLIIIYPHIVTNIHHYVEIIWRKTWLCLWQSLPGCSFPSPQCAISNHSPGVELKGESKFLDFYLFSQNPDLFSQNSNLLLLFLPA